MKSAARAERSDNRRVGGKRLPTPQVSNPLVRMPAKVVSKAPAGTSERAFAARSGNLNGTSER